MAFLSRTPPMPEQEEQYLTALDTYLRYLHEALNFYDTNYVRRRLDALEMRIAALEGTEQEETNGNHQ